ncbi:uncharacterized protein [Ptychodera flava]|uniref:uncharacterized protein n=1 Tax=Ptychodera flava TaxID=63121 RepID=UPI00396A1402
MMKQFVFAVVMVSLLWLTSAKVLPIKENEGKSHNIHKRVVFNVDEVEDVDVRSFGDYLNTENAQQLLIFYYAPWCGVCEKLWNNYLAVERTLAQQGVGYVKFGRMNCDWISNRMTCMQQGALRQYPKIYLYERGQDVGTDVSDEFKDVDAALAYFNVL